MRPTGRVKLLIIVIATLMIFVLSPATVQAQGYPAFNIDSWMIDKESPQYGDEFKILPNSEFSFKKTGRPPTMFPASFFAIMK